MYKAYFPELTKNVEGYLIKNTLTTKFLYYPSLDKNGIIYIKFKILEGKKAIYFPITIIQYALSNYSKFIKTRNIKYKKSFLKHAEWLKNNLTYIGNYAYFKHTWKMNIVGYKFKKPYDWASCMPQGMVISVFIRAYSITKERRYLELCKKLINSFEVDYRKKGGILEIDKQGNYWYLEFPAKIKHARVLNGMIFALLGLYEYWKYTKDKKAKYLFDKGVKTLKENIHKFNLKTPLFNYSRYDDGKIFYSGKRYHEKVHIPQLKILYKLTNNKIFMYYYQKWQKNKSNWFIKIIDLPLLCLNKIRGFLL
ncbi:MAG: D-glucuronyl C5-epimerase family protein [Promethearchaeota archaeon]